MTGKIRLQDALADLAGSFLVLVAAHKADRETNPDHDKDCKSCRDYHRSLKRKGAKTNE